MNSMPSPFDVTSNISSVERNRKVHKFLDPQGNEPEGDNKDELTIKLNKKLLNNLLDWLPWIRNRMDQYFNLNESEDVEAMEDFEQFYQELIQLKELFQNLKEKQPNH